MSLESLLRLRRTGSRPPTVTVIVGTPPAWLDTSAPDKVVIDSDPARLNLHALYGMEVNLIDIQPDTDLLLKAMDATAAAGARPLGACTHEGACGVSAEHELSMRRYRENLIGR
ncbi:hypothetical protein WG922_21460 [Ramlibacter sp. AN1015]|uniref:hypothetical protein n=1 Tax=Ramlibacter sp. AN1015 TaxID=3133428 RepID=UPI0030BA349E